MSTGRKILLYTLYFVIVVVLGVAIILAFTHHSSTKTSVPKSGNSTTVTDKAPKAQSSPATDSASNASNAARDALNNARSTANGTQLVNTGPGSTLAIFIATSLVGTVAYRRYLLRRIA